ncbi:hypothetical protein BDW62DRAFT_94960 [Aspergillus aurantiobrunneus]
MDLVRSFPLHVALLLAYGLRMESVTGGRNRERAQSISNSVSVLELRFLFTIRSNATSTQRLLEQPDDAPIQPHGLPDDAIEGMKGEETDEGSYGEHEPAQDNKECKGDQEITEQGQAKTGDEEAEKDEEAAQEEEEATEAGYHKRIRDDESTSSDNNARKHQKTPEFNFEEDGPDEIGACELE